MFVSLQFRLELKKEDEEKLIQLIRKQSSAVRVAYNMLKKVRRRENKKNHTPKYTKD